MATISNDDTKVDRWIKYFKNHWLFAPLILLAIVLTGIGGLAAVSKDFREWMFTSSFTSESVEIVENTFERAIKDHPGQSVRLEALKNLYVDFARREFQAAKYFAPKVKKYYLVENLRPCDMDSFFILNTEDFQDPRSVIDPESFVFSQDADGNAVVTFWHQFTCFRAKKSKYESCRVFTKIIFDTADRIIYFNDEKIEELVFTEERND
jgi:hypothetical protein